MAHNRLCAGSGLSGSFSALLPTLLTAFLLPLLAAFLSLLLAFLLSLLAAFLSLLLTLSLAFLAALFSGSLASAVAAITALLILTPVSPSAHASLLPVGFG